VAVNSGSDGGMHPAFVAKLQPQAIVDTTGRPAAYTQPGSGLPTLVRLPRPLEPSSVITGPTLTQVASADATQSVVAVQSSEQSSGNFLTRLFSSGSQTGNTANTAAVKKDPPKKDAAKKDAVKKDAAKKDTVKKDAAKKDTTKKDAPSASASSKTQAKSGAASTTAGRSASQSSSNAKASTGKDEPKRKVAVAGASAKSDSKDMPSSASAFAGGAATGGSQPMTGAQPVISTSSFDNRFGGWR
jgi:pentapeptide MXKDX repeat protein